MQDHKLHVQRRPTADIYQLKSGMRVDAECWSYLRFKLAFGRFAHLPSLAEIPPDEDGAHKQQNILHDGCNRRDVLVSHDPQFTVPLPVSQAAKLREIQKRKMLYQWQF